MDYQSPVQVKPVAGPPPRGIGPGGWFAMFFAVMLLISIGMNLFIMAANMDVQIPNLSAGGEFRESLVDGEESAEKKIVIIDIAGVIMNQPQSSPLGIPMPSMVQTAIAHLRAAQADPNVRAVILNVDSPGGGVDASEVIYNEVIRTQKSGGVDGKKIIVQMNGLAASGGYYVSASADAIIAHPTTLTGSIGVIAQFPIYHKAMEYLNIEMVTIKSGSKKDWGSPYDEFTSEEQAYLQGIIDNAYDRFVGIVAEGRGKTREEILPLATGEVFTATAALENGLIDEIGFLDDAIAKARSLVGESDAKVIRYAPAASFLQQMLEGKQMPVVVNTGLQVNLTEMISRAPRFMYMWQVGN